MTDLDLKRELFMQCDAFIENRLVSIQKVIAEIRESLTAESKSSAGDKHETGRAMLQLEREKAGKQLAEIEKLKQYLGKVDISKTSKIIGLGSVVYTDQANYFISISAGELYLKDQKFFAIAPNTPIGLLLIRKKVNEHFSFRNQDFEILKII